ncbi:hypothetical protein BCR43DRAFT_562586 [Syncephalastrum racemosum]|uniref:SLS1 N-terminal domain-containing protein n=1 Tax=Syncephalastrum racemosum TaxID=13706 RepID=A0A1X2HJX0_SYNRA|nr:hypothetical protein BCR43DRAFT_562586 [Syncephalastrum racemosum]
MASLRCTLSWVRAPLVRPSLNTRPMCARFHAAAIRRSNDDNLFPDDSAAQDRTIFGAIEALQPVYKQRSDEEEKRYKSVLSNKEYKKVRDSLNNSFTVPQLRLYLRQQQRFANKSLRKRDLISHIMHDLWGLKSKDMIEEEERQRRKHDIKHIGRGAKHDLFFLVQDNGEALRQIEQQEQVRITVQFDQLKYVIEGQPDNVERARHKVEGSLDFKHTAANIPQLTAHLAWNDFTSRIGPIVTDISKVCEAYIDLIDQKFHFWARTEDAIEDAQHMLELSLTELEFTEKPSLNASDGAVIEYPSTQLDLQFMPVHDPLALPLVSRSFGWSRIQKSQVTPIDTSVNELPYYFVHSRDPEQAKSQGSLHWSSIKDRLLEPLDISKGEVTRLKATFGNALFQNPILGQGPNILQPGLVGNFSLNGLQGYLANVSSGRKSFMATHPPTRLTAPFMPISIEGGRHRRSVHLHYVNRSLLATLGDVHAEQGGLERLEVGFNVQETGDLQLDRIVGEHGRSTIDMLDLAGTIDVRLLANRCTLFGTSEQPGVQSLTPVMSELLEQCGSVGYSELECPMALTKVTQEEDMTLAHILFRYDSQYLVDNAMVIVSDIEDQITRSSRTELSVVPVEANTVPDSVDDIKLAGVESWDSFVDTVHSIARRWRYAPSS